MSLDGDYEEFLAHAKRLAGLSGVAAIASWDQEVMMPAKGAQGRAEQMGVLAAISHEQAVSPRYGDLIQSLSTGVDDPVAQANVRLAKRHYDRAIKVPARLAFELARATSLAQGIWAKARSDNRFGDFAPVLKQVLALKREEADCIAQNGQSAYDALLNDFEPGMTVEILQPLLESMRPRLTALREKIAGGSSSNDGLEGDFASEGQMALARRFGDITGYDWEGGRLDLSTHPFSTGIGPGDVRITTRVRTDNPFDCLYSTLHEIGHALYEQGLPQDHAFTPVCTYASMGVHESQSRLWENQIGRSRAFCQWLVAEFNATFSDRSPVSAKQLYRAVNQVETGFIRTDADEVHYNLHVLLRFELERELISGELEVEDLENEWNSRFKRDFDLDVPDAAHGVLQDVHWSVGAFGYFPTYSLGTIYSAQLFDAMVKDIPKLPDLIAVGDTSPALAWLRRHVHSKGALVAPHKLVETAAGAPLSAQPLLDYLEQKYGEF